MNGETHPDAHPMSDAHRSDSRMVKDERELVTVIYATPVDADGIRMSPPPPAPGPATEPAPIPTPGHDPSPSREGPSSPPAEPQPVSPPQHMPEPISPNELPKAAAPQPDDLIVSPEAACGLVSEHGGEIVIMDDGRVVFMNASAHLVEIAAALDPDNADIQKRLNAIERARRAAQGAEPATGGEPSSAP